ncbi:MAG: 2-oxoglutarate and iron-dependent oxygenase domain-containing protein [Archangium sp.]
MPHDALPVFDLGPIRAGRFEPASIEALRNACERHGFFYVRGHGVPPELERRLEKLSAEFFALPLHVKAQLPMSKGGSAWRGWFPLEGELTSGAADLKEGIYFGDEVGPDDRRVRAGWPMHGLNLFPDVELPALRGAVLEFMSAQREVAKFVMRALAASLGLETDFFERSLTREPLSLFRIFHYPAPAPEKQSAWGVGEHTDYGLLTVLKQDDCGGLEVKTPSGWVAAPPIEGTFVCNLGDMLDRMTGGLYRSTPHRVRNASGRSRYSWPFFFDPAFDAVVAPLPVARVRPVEQDAAERWDRASVHSLSGTYGDYLRGKVSKVFPELAGELTR